MASPVTSVSQRVAVVTLAKRLDVRRWRPQEGVEPQWYSKRPEFRFTRASLALRVGPPNSEQRWAATATNCGPRPTSVAADDHSQARCLRLAAEQGVIVDAM